jgi:RluA family pseudouridine synthase
MTDILPALARAVKSDAAFYANLPRGRPGAFMISPMRSPHSSPRRSGPTHRRSTVTTGLRAGRQRAQPDRLPLSLRQELRDRLLFLDRDIIVLDKPAGLAVHPGPYGGPTLEAALDALRFDSRMTPALAHRLDRDTSGCLVLARRRSALRRLHALFAAGHIQKTYWAVVHGAPEADSGIADQPLRKLNRKEGWKMVADPAGQSAITGWRLLGRGDGLSWVECKPRTGRTHQVRVHLARLGCPILGDPVYGPAPKEPRGQAAPLHLHARGLLIPMTENGPPIAVTAPVPDHMRRALTVCGWEENRSLSSARSE